MKRSVSLVVVIIMVLFFVPYSALASVTAENQPEVREVSEPVSTPGQNPEDAILGIGTLSVSASPIGADVLVDGTRYEQAVAPCAIELEAGKHTISLVIPGYEAFSETVSIEEGQTTTLEALLLPALPLEAVVLTVNTEEDIEPLQYSEERTDFTASDLGDTITFRQAMLVVNNDTSSTAYRIEFADNVNAIAIHDGNITMTRGNLAINGDRNRDGVPDVAMTVADVEADGQFILFRDSSDLVLCGLKVHYPDSYGQFQSPFVIRGDEYSPEYTRMENIYVLGCDFKNVFIPFCGVCKPYGTGANGYEQNGAIDYRNINFCGNKMENTNCFFGYSGDCDYSVTDGMYYCANTGDLQSCLTFMCADCNTWYIYGRDTIQGNGGIPGQKKGSEYCCLRNVLISGNQVGQTVTAAGVFGNSNNIVENVMIRNNIFSGTCNIRAAQVGDEKNQGSTVITSGNVLQNISFVNNVFSYCGSVDFINLGVVDPDVPPDSSSTLIAENNQMKNILFENNVYYGDNSLSLELIAPGVDYTLESGLPVCRSFIVFNNAYYANMVVNNNTFTGLVFRNNTRGGCHAGFVEEVIITDPIVEQEVMDALLRPTGSDEEVVFIDPVFEQKVRESMARPIGPITRNECLATTSLNLSNLTIPMDQWDTLPEDQMIHSLEDLRYFPNLQSFDFALNAVEDIGPLSSLDQLTYLEAPHNRIKDISPIASLQNLQHAVFWENQIIDVSPVRNLDNLKVFSVFSNQVSDLSPLAGLTQLTTLEIHDNPVDDFSPLAVLYNKLQEKDFTIDLSSVDKSDITQSIVTNTSEEIDNSDILKDFTPLGSFGGMTTAIAFSNSYAYVAKGTSVIVLDCSDGSLKQVGSVLSLESFISDLTVNGNKLYVALGSAGVFILDISDPLIPSIIGQYTTECFAETVVVCDNVLYIAAGDKGLITVDVVDPADPRFIGQIFSGKHCFDVTLTDSIALVAAAEDGLLIASLENPKAPSELAMLDTPGVARSVLVDGDKVFVADDWKGVSVADISDPIKPVYISHIDTAGNAFGLAKEGNILYVADAYMGLRILDISDLSLPKDLSNFAPEYSQLTHLALYNGLLYCVDRGNGLFCFNISQPYSIKLLNLYAGSIPLPLILPSELLGWENRTEITRLGILGVIDNDSLQPYNEITRAEFASMLCRILHLDPEPDTRTKPFVDVPVGDPALQDARNVVRLGLMATIESDIFGPNKHMTYTDVVSALLKLVNRMPSNDDRDSYMCAVSEYGLDRVFIGDPQQAVQRANALAMLYKTIAEIPDSITNRTLLESSMDITLEAAPSNAYNLTINDGYAYIPALKDGLFIIDIHEPSNPRQIAHLDMPVPVNLVKIKGNYAYVFGLFDVYIVDISDPSNPYRVNEMIGNTGGPTTSAVIEGNKIYMTNEWGLLILSIEDPTRCELISDTALMYNEIWSSDMTADIFVRDDIAYIAFGERGIEIYDVSDPMNIQLINQYKDTGFLTTNVQFLNGYLFVRYEENVNNTRNIRMLDITDPMQPIQVGNINDIGDSSFNFSIGISNDIILIPNERKGIQLIDISDMKNPIRLGYINTPGIANHVEINDGVAFVTDGIGGVFILALPGQDTEVLRKDKSQFSLQASWYSSAPIEQCALTAEKAEMRIIEERNRSSFSETLVVTTSNESEQGSLRWCLECIQEGGRILFDPSVFPPDQPTTIFAENGYELSRVGHITIDASNAGVIIDGSNVPSNKSGLLILSPSNIIRGLQLQNFSGSPLAILQNGGNIIGGSRSVGAGPIGEGNLFIRSGYITLNGYTVTDNIIVGNNVGMEADGITPAGNNDGIQLRSFAARNVIGIDRSEYRNLISATSRDGISSMGYTYGNLIEGNYVGTDITGTHPFGNEGHGINIECGFGSVIRNNVSCDNGRIGVLVGNEQSNFNVVIGNSLGLGADGISMMPNWNPIFAHGGMGGENFYNILGLNGDGMENKLIYSHGKDESSWPGVYDTIFEGIVYKYSRELLY